MKPRASVVYNCGQKGSKLEKKLFSKYVFKLNLRNELVTLTGCLVFIFFIVSYTSHVGYKDSVVKYSRFINTYLQGQINIDTECAAIEEYRYDDQVPFETLRDKIISKQSGYRHVYRHIKKREGSYSPPLTEEQLEVMKKLPENGDLYNHTIIKNDELFIINRRKVGIYSMLSLYGVTRDPILKKNLESAGFTGFVYRKKGVDIHWFKDNLKPEIFIPMEEYKTLIFTSVFINVHNSLNIDNLCYVIDNKPEIREQQYLLIFLVVVMIIKITFNILTSQSTIKHFQTPLKRLLYHTEKLASNEISEKLSKQNYDFQEYQQLAETFNRVLLSRELSELKLFKSFEQMEDIVNKRTRELTEANKQLTSAIKRAKEANMSKSHFLANISHEIRTPLNCIMGFCDIILTEGHNETIHKQVQHILHESETLLHLINEILDHSKIDAGKMKLIESEVNLQEILSSLINSGKVQVGTKEIELSYTISEELPRVFIADELRLYQVISNLFFNAIKFTHQGKVSITADRLKNKNPEYYNLRIRVRDTGIGIPGDKIDHIFDKFEQVDGSLTREYRGSGLGLTISRRIIELMNGSVTVTSTINKGSTFTVIIPISINALPFLPTEEELELENAENSDISGKILLVEDYPVNQIVARKHLEMAGHTVFIAENGKEAVKKCSEEEFDLILMDLQMPVMDGFKATRLIRELKNSNNNVPILAMTANAMETAQTSCLESGMNDIITKPLRKKQFTSSVSRWLFTGLQSKKLSIGP